MKLPFPGPAWNAAQERQRNTILQQADAQNLKRDRDNYVGQGRLILTDQTTGTNYELFIDDGSLLARQVDVVDATITIVARLT